LAIVAAGFTPGEADQLRRAMGAWRKTGVIEKFREKLLLGMRERGLSDEFADQVFRQIRGFGEYGFPESHAASFALLVYVSAWLKHHHPAAFTTALLNAQPMGFYAPAQLVADAQRHGVTVLPPDVNHSQWDACLEPLPPTQPPVLPAPTETLAIRLGLKQIRGIAQSVGERIVSEREELGPYFSVSEFSERTSSLQATVLQLSSADAFASLQQDRRAALWQALAQNRRPVDQPLFGLLPLDDDTPGDWLRPLAPDAEVLEDYRTLGLSLKSHPLAFQRESLNQRGVTLASQLPNLPPNRPVRVAGLVILRQRPATAKGITFVTLEDESGPLNLIVKPSVWEKHYQICRLSRAWLVEGTLETRSGVTHVIAERLHDLQAALNLPLIRSRDFR
jgi:error-prone DNA polymerase